MNFLHYKIIGAPKKFKHQPCPLVRSSSLKFGQHFWNLSHETVPLEGGCLFLFRYTIRLRCTEYSAPALSHINRVTCHPNTNYPFQRRSADYSQPHSGNFVKFLRRLEFALASTFLYVFGVFSILRRLSWKYSPQWFLVIAEGLEAFHLEVLSAYWGSTWISPRGFLSILRVYRTCISPRGFLSILRV